MRARTLLFAVACAVVLGSASGAFAVTTSPNNPSSGGLVEEPKRFDGTEVTFEGEAITQAMVRGDMAWIHINDDAYYLKNVEEGAELGGYNSGMAVWLPKDQSDKIETYGDYKHEGDVVRVVGTFNAACGQHGGDMDIHATTLEIVLPGRPAQDPVKPWKLTLAVVLSGLVGLLYVAERRLGHRELLGLLKRR